MPLLAVALVAATAAPALAYIGPGAGFAADREFVPGFQCASAVTSETGLQVGRCRAKRIIGRKATADGDVRARAHFDGTDRELVARFG